MQYILNETEYQAHLAAQQQVAELRKRLDAALGRIKDFREHVALCNKKIAEQAHLLLAQEAELAQASSVIRKTTKDLQQTQEAWGKQEAQIREMRRDAEGTAKALADARAEAERLQELADERLTAMHNLSNEIKALQPEYVCIARHPKTGTTLIVALEHVDAFFESGWTMSEPMLVHKA